jgi:hypothetical protein
VRPMPAPQWEASKRRVIRYMADTYQPPGSVEVLKKIPLQLWEGTNSFSDEFELLFLKSDMATYIELEREDDAGNFRATTGFPDVADALRKLGHPIRFIAVEMDTEEGIAVVSVPSLTVTSDIVEAALRDAETLIGTNGAELPKCFASRSGISVPKTSSMSITASTKSRLSIALGMIRTF